MANIQIEIQGDGASEASEALLEIPGIDGTWQPVEGTYKEITIATVATIVGIVGGSLAIAEQIRKWYIEYSKHQEATKRIAKVLIEHNGQRILLENATIEQIQQILDG